MGVEPVEGQASVIIALKRVLELSALVVGLRSLLQPVSLSLVLLLDLSPLLLQGSLRLLLWLVIDLLAYSVDLVLVDLLLLQSPVHCRLESRRVDL